MTTANVPQQSAPTPQYSDGHVQKHIGTAYKWLFFFGGLGAHRFYQGKVGTGLLWLFTGGLVGVGVIVDIFTLDSQIVETNARNNVAPTSR